MLQHQTLLIITYHLFVHPFWYFDDLSLGMSCKSLRLEGLLAITLILSSLHRFSVRRRLVLWLSHSKMFILLPVLRHMLIIWKNTLTLRIIQGLKQPFSDKKYISLFAVSVCLSDELHSNGNAKTSPKSCSIIQIIIVYKMKRAVTSWCRSEFSIRSYRDENHLTNWMKPRDMSETYTSCVTIVLITAQFDNSKINLLNLNTANYKKN